MINYTQDHEVVKEGVSMRYIVTMFWAFALGQVAGYLGSSLSSQTYDFVQTTIFSLIVGVFIILLGLLTPPAKEKAETNS